MSRAIVFGARGALGSAIVEELSRRGWAVDRAGRSAGDDVDLAVDDPAWTTGRREPYAGVVWAQGINAQGSVLDSSDDEFARVFDANVAFIPRTLRSLDSAGLLGGGARGVVLSSVWQITARADKAAYVASKAATGGLVQAMSADLGDRMQINAVLPGVIDTPMTRANLDPAQLEGIERDTPGGRLATPEQVAAAAAWLLDPSAAGINGQSVVVDNGWSSVRHV